MRLVLVLLVVLAMPVDAVAAKRRVDASALMAAARERPLTARQKLRQIELPGPREAVRVLRQPAPNVPAGTMYAAATAPDGTIYDPDGLIANDPGLLAHESFHALDSQTFTDRDRARLMRMARIKPGAWDTGTGGHSPESRTSPSEVLADWYAALATRRDPGRSWEAGYEGEPPSRRQLLRFGRSLERLGHRYGLSEYVRPR